jgi:hypothetical protein
MVVIQSNKSNTDIPMVVFVVVVVVVVIKLLGLLITCFLG